MHPGYDLVDYSGRNRPFDQRSVEAVLDFKDVIMEDTPRSKVYSATSGQDLSQIVTVIPELTNLTSVPPPENTEGDLEPIPGKAPRSQQQPNDLPPLLQSDPLAPAPVDQVQFNQTIAVLYVEPPQPEQHTLPPLNHLRKAKEYDVETFQREVHNNTWHFKRCINGYFFNYNEQTLKKLQNIITIADRGMTLLLEEIDRARHGQAILTNP